MWMRNIWRPRLKAGGPDVKGYRDFREVLARKDIDIVHIPTPPHWHALISIAAAKAGKDIWCEKPMSRTIAEGEAVKAAMAKYKRIFRLNTWFRFEGGFYGMGVPVKPDQEDRAERTAGLAAQGHARRDDRIRLEAESMVRPHRPDAATGASRTGLRPLAGARPEEAVSPAPRSRDLPWLLGLRRRRAGRHGPALSRSRCNTSWARITKARSTIEADTAPQDPDAVLPWRRISLKYADGCEIILDGENKEKGAAFICRAEGQALQGLRIGYSRPASEATATCPIPSRKLTDFIKAVKTRQKFALNEINGHRSCTLVNLAKIAVQTGSPLQFDSKKQRFVGNDKANASSSSR